jgi:hypothetical protein
MDERVESNAVGQDTRTSAPLLKLLKVLRMPVKKSSFGILRITAEVSARCNGCGEGIEVFDLACEVSLEETQEQPDLRFHHRCYRTWSAIEAFTAPGR